MKSDVIIQQLESSVTRRRVVGTGVKLAYAAPIVAASFKLNSAAAHTVSAGCVAGTCLEPNLCGERCGCRTADGASLCLQQLRCSEADICETSATCPEGYVCLTPSCCRDEKPRCVPACFNPTISEQANFMATSFEEPNGDWVLGPGI